MIKVQRLTIRNIGILGEESIDFDGKPLLMFYGDVRQGKSTVLNAIRWCLGGNWPSDIIRHGETAASVKLEFDGGSVSRSWYIGKDGTTKSRDIVFVRNGTPVQRPAGEIAKLLNPFLANQDYLRNMNEVERKAFFAEVLSVDTRELDGEATACADQASTLRAVIKAQGDVRLVPLPAEPEAPEALQIRLDHLLAQYEDEVGTVQIHNMAAVAHNAIYTQRTDRMQELNVKLMELNLAKAQLEGWLNDNPLQDLTKMPEEPEEAEALRAQVSNANLERERYENAKRENERAQLKVNNEKELKVLEERQRQIKTEKGKLLKNYAKTCGIEGLSFDDNGQVVFEGTTAGMLSTSQLMRLSSALAALYPSGFDLDLIDRAESLGQSIYEFIDRAKQKDLTILATVVGEAPSQSPAEVGVFVVKQGKITAK
jgi:hypothetical protein